MSEHTEAIRDDQFVEVSYDDAIPNNVNLSEDRQLLRALESWHPNYIDWWKEMGPEGFQEADVFVIPRLRYSFAQTQVEQLMENRKESVDGRSDVVGKQVDAPTNERPRWVYPTWRRDADVGGAVDDRDGQRVTRGFLDFIDQLRYRR